MKDYIIIGLVVFFVMTWIFIAFGIGAAIWLEQEIKRLQDKLMRLESK